MTATMDTTTAQPVPTEYDVPTCWECGGPCATHKGSVHGWRCSACIDRYLAEGEKRFAALSFDERLRRTRARDSGAQ